MSQGAHDPQSSTPPPSGSLKHRRDVLLHEIPPAALRAFQRYYQGRLADALHQANTEAQDTASGAADPYLVERHVWETLVREAEGRDDPDGLGDVPETADKIVGIVVPLTDPRQQGPRPRTATAGTARSELSPQRWGALAAVLLGTLVLGLWWRGRPPPPQTSTLRPGHRPAPAAVLRPSTQRRWPPTRATACNSPIRSA